MKMILILKRLLQKTPPFQMATQFKLFRNGKFKNLIFLNVFYHTLDQIILETTKIQLISMC